MPSEYQCKNCSLHLTIGGFHYHDFSDGYGGSTLFACRDCGLEGEVMHAIEDRGEPDYGVYDVVTESVSADNRVNWLLGLRKTGVSLSEVKAIIDNLPYTLAERVSRSEANEIIEDMGGVHLACYRLIETGRVANRWFGELKEELLFFYKNKRFDENLRTAERVCVEPRQRVPGNPVGRFEIQDQVCLNCGGGSFFYDHRDIDDEKLTRCPNCSEVALSYTGGFIT